MHKGYAFVQFTGPFDARSACLGEDGRTICGQVIDVNMVSEPKPHQQGKGSTKPGQKRSREESPADEYDNSAYFYHTKTCSFSHFLSRLPCNNGSLNGATNGSNNGKMAEATDAEPVAKKSKSENNGASSPVPREPFDVAQLKNYGKN